MATREILLGQYGRDRLH